MSEWEPTQPHEPTRPDGVAPPPPDVPGEPTGPADTTSSDTGADPWDATRVGGAGPAGSEPIGEPDPAVAEGVHVTEPVPDEELPPWYRQRGPVAATIGVGLAMIFLLVAFLIWVLDGDDEELATVDTSTTSTSVVVTTSVPATVVTTAAPTTTSSTTTEPPTTEPPTTEPDATTTTAGPTTVPATIVAPPPPTAAPPTAAPTTAPPATTAAPTTSPPATTTVPPPQVTEPPRADATVWDIVAASPDLSRLRQLVEFADLVDAVDGDGPITLLAPSNSAFDVLERAPGGAALLGDRDRVRELLMRHLVDGEALGSGDLFARDEITVATGETLPVDGDARTVDGSRVVVDDVDGANGVLHVLDRVMVP